MLFGGRANIRPFGCVAKLLTILGLKVVYFVKLWWTFAIRPDFAYKLLLVKTAGSPMLPAVDFHLS